MPIEELDNLELNKDELGQNYSTEKDAPEVPVIEEVDDTSKDTTKVDDIKAPVDTKIYKWDGIKGDELKQSHANLHSTMLNPTLITRAEEAGVKTEDYLFDLFKDDFNGDKGNFKIALKNVEKETNLTLENTTNVANDAYLEDFFGKKILTPGEGAVKYKEDNGTYSMSKDGEWQTITERTFNLGKRNSQYDSKSGEYIRGNKEVVVPESNEPVLPSIKDKKEIPTNGVTREKFATGIVYAENSGKFDYTAINSESSATGAYQFLYEREGVKEYLSKNHGITSREGFKNSKEAQDGLLDYMLEDKPGRYPFMAKSLQKDYKEFIPKSIGYNQLLGLEHFAGHGELRELFARVREKEITKEEVFDFVPKGQEVSNLSIGEYLKRFNKGFDSIGNNKEDEEETSFFNNPIISISDGINSQVPVNGEDANEEAIIDSREVYEQSLITSSDISPLLDGNMPDGVDFTGDLDDVWNNMNLSAIGLIESDIEDKLNDPNVLDDERAIIASSFSDVSDIEQVAEMTVNNKKLSLYTAAADGLFGDILSVYESDIEEERKANQEKLEQSNKRIKSSGVNMMMPGATTSIEAATQIGTPDIIQFTAEEFLKKDRFNNIPPAMKLIMAERIQSLYNDKLREPEFNQKKGEMLTFWGASDKNSVVTEVQNFIDTSADNGMVMKDIITKVNELYPVDLKLDDNGKLDLDFKDEKLYNEIDGAATAHANELIPGQTNIDSSLEMVLKGSWNETIPGYLQWALTGRKPFSIIGRTPTEKESFAIGMGGFILDPTMWMPGAAIGFAGTKVGTKLLTRQMAKWQTRLALKYGDEAAKTTINLLAKKQAAKIAAPIASGATLGTWKFNHEVLNQRVNKSGWGTNDIDYWDSVQEGGIDAVLGASIYGLSTKVMGRYKLMDEAMALKGRSPLSRGLLKYGVAHPTDLAGQTAVFVGGGAVLHGEVPTLEEGKETALFLLSMKFAHGVQNGLFTYVKTGKFKKGEGMPANFSEIERDIINTKFNLTKPNENATVSEKVEWDNNTSKEIASNKEIFNELLHDKTVPLTLRSKILMREFGLKLGVNGDTEEDKFKRNKRAKGLVTTEVKTIFNGSNFDVIKLNENGDVLDVARFKNSTDANTFAQTTVKNISDNIARFNYNNEISLDNKVEIVDYLKNELNSSLGEVTEILNSTSPTERTHNQNILVEAFKSKVQEVSDLNQLKIKDEATESLKSKGEEVTESSVENEILKLRKLKSKQDEVILKARVKKEDEQEIDRKQKADNQLLRNIEIALSKDGDKPIYATEESIAAINKENLTENQKEALIDIDKSIKAFKSLGLDVYIHTNNKEYMKSSGEAIEGVNIQGHRNTKTGDIHMNMSHLDKLTAPHEVGHHFGEILKKANPEKYKVIEEGVYKLINENPEFAEVLDYVKSKDAKGNDIYKDVSEKKNEAFAEFIAKLQKGDYTVETQNKFINGAKVKLNKIMENLGIDYKFETNNEVLTFLDGITKKIDKGEKISLEEFSTKKEPDAGKRLFNEPNPESKDISKEYLDKNKELIGESSEINLNFKLDVNNSKELADAYENMKHEPNNPEVKSAFKAMATETIDQFKLVEGKGYKVEIWKGEGQPYANSAEMIKDIRENKHMYIYSTKSGFGNKAITKEQKAENAMLEGTEFTDVNGEPLLVNDLFRFVHDFFGHTEHGNGFGAKGEEVAWMNHSRMYSPEARKAMTTETRGQNSWVNFGSQMRKEDGSMYKKGEEGYLSPQDRDYAPQKVGLLPEKFTAIPESKGETQLRVSKQADLHNKKGGSTFSQSGNVITEGFAVSRYSDRTKKIDGEKVTEKDITEFINKNKDILSENPDAVIGTWYNKETGKTYIDVSEVQLNRAEGIRVGIENNQISIMNLKTLEEIPTGGTGEAQPRVSEERGRVFTEIDNIISKTKKRLTEDVNPETLEKNAVSYLQKSKWYEEATDKEREAAVIDVRSKLAITEKKSPSANVAIKRFDKLPKEKKVTLSEKVLLKEVLKSEAKGAKGAEGYIKEINNKLIDYIKESDLNDSSIGKSLLKKVASVTNEKQFDNVVDALEVAVERQTRRDLIGNVRVLKEKVRKKLKKGDYTNQSDIIKDLLDTPSHKIKDNTVLGELVVKLEELNRSNVALVEPKKIEELNKSISELVAKSEKSIPTQGSLGHLSTDIKDRLKKELKSESTEEIDTVKKLRSDILRFERNLEELNIEGKLAEGQYEQYTKELNDFVTKFKGKSTEFNKERFETAKDVLKGLDTSKLKGDNKRVIDELVDNVINEEIFIDDMSYADNLYITALDLSFEVGKNNEPYIPTQVIAKLNRKAFAAKHSKEISDGIANGVEKLGLSDLSSKEIENILGRQNLAFIDEAVGTGKKSPIYKAIVNPIERGLSSLLTDVGATMSTFNAALGRKVNEKTSFETEAKRKKINTKVGMLMIQLQENSAYSKRDVWGYILGTENRKKTYKNKETPVIIQEIYDALPKKRNDEGVFVVDVEKAYKGLTAREKRVFDASRKILNELESKQKHINEYRGIPFNAIENYVPLLGKSETSKADGDGYTLSEMKDKPWAANMANSNVKMASDRGKARTSNNIRIYEPNIERILTDAVQQVNRDYHLTDAFGKMGETINNVKNNWGKEKVDGLNVFADAVQNRMIDAAKFQFESTPGNIAQKFMGATYAYKLGRFLRVPIEMGTEVYRVNLSVGNKYSPEIIIRSGLDRMNKNLINSKNKLYSFLRSDTKLEDLSSGVKYEKEYTVFDKLLQQTKSPYIHKFNRWQIEGQYDMNNVMANKGVVVGMAQYALGLPDRMTIHMAWMPRFMAEFKAITGEKFSYEKYSEDASYGKNNHKAILEAASIGDRAAQMYKNTSMKGQQRTKIRTFNPLKGKDAFNYYVDANSAAAPYLTYMSTFGALESAMFSKSVSDSYNGINSTKGDGVRAAVGIFSAGVGYGLMTQIEYQYGAYRYNQSVYGEDSEEAHEKAKEIAKIITPEGIGTQILANVAFLNLTKFAQPARLVALSTAGMISQATTDKDLKVKLDEYTNKILMGDPMLAEKYGDKTQILKDLVPNIHYGLGVITDNVGNINDFGEFYDAELDSDKKRVELWKLVESVNDLQKLYFMLNFGTQIFGQKYVDQYIRKEQEILLLRAIGDYNDL